MRKIYRRRWQWWPPNHVTDWWRPRIFLGSDEDDRRSVSAVLPPFGCFVWFWDR